MVYCNNCGAKNPDDSNYCSSCGSPLQPATTAPSQPRQPSTPTQPAEQVYASISGLTKGLMGRENYVLLITPQQLMFVRLDSKELTEIVTAARQEAGNQGKGFFGKIGAQLGAHSNAGEYFHGWDPQQIHNRYNVTPVHLNSVQELRVRDRQDQDNKLRYELNVKATGYDEKFRFNNYRKEHSQALKQLLGGRFKSNIHF